MEILAPLTGAVIGVCTGIAHNIYGQGAPDNSGEPRRGQLLRDTGTIALGVFLGEISLRLESKDLSFIAALALSYGVTNLVPTLYHFLGNRNN